ncbi:hypothetical protein GCM10009737_13240 [Nocardioides lentus]|uniref:N-acetyltransferase domain-containing protein n=2 Tax=Nocardioides lentus TaxID=338077 RepID=A0ABN2P5T1_9ACTN
MTDQLDPLDMLAVPTPPAGDVELVALGGEHARWVAATHVAELPHGLFPRLGRGFVRRWHAAHVASPHGTAYVALRGGEPVGFLLGSTDRRAGVAWLLEHRRGPLVRAAARAFATRPRLLAEFAATRAGRYLRRLRGRPAAGTAGTPSAERIAVLEAIVVAPSARGNGIGTRLVARFLDDTTTAGADRVELVTKAGAEGAAAFYERVGWTRVGSHVDRDGDTVLTYRAPAVAGR